MKIIFYDSPSGRVPVEDFIESLTEKEQRKIMKMLDLQAELGFALTFPHTRQIKGKLWELRVTHNKRAFRLFYFSTCDRELMYVHAVVKARTRHIQSDVEVAEKRMKEFLDRD